MSGWTLIETTNSVCDECGNPAACNVYRKPHTCQCLRCREIRKANLYEFFHVCGYCMNKWLKSREQFDYGD